MQDAYVYQNMLHLHTSVSLSCVQHELCNFDPTDGVDAYGIGADERLLHPWGVLTPLSTADCTMHPWVCMDANMGHLGRAQGCVNVPSAPAAHAAILTSWC